MPCAVFSLSPGSANVPGRPIRKYRHCAAAWPPPCRCSRPTTEGSQRVSRKRRLGVFFVLSALLAGAAAYVLWQRYTGFADAPVAGIESGESLLVERGDSFPLVLRKLREAG